MSIESELAELRTDIKYIKAFIDEDRAKFNKHIEESEVYRREVEKMSSLSDRLTTHSNQDILLFEKASKQAIKFFKINMIVSGSFLKAVSD